MYKTTIIHCANVGSYFRADILEAAMWLNEYCISVRKKCVIKIE